MTPPLSQGQQGPRRPPKSPHREGDPSVTSQGSHDQQKVFASQQQSFVIKQQQQQQQQQNQHQFHQLLPVDATPPPELETDHRGGNRSLGLERDDQDRSPKKSKLLKLPFAGLGKKKRDSTQPRTVSQNDGRASTMLRGRKSQADLDFSDDDEPLAPPAFRNRVVSSPQDSRPPRSQSSMGFFK